MITVVLMNLWQAINTKNYPITAGMGEKARTVIYAISEVHNEHGKEFEFSDSEEKSFKN